MAERPGPMRREILFQRIQESLSPVHVELVDESYKHSVGPDAGTHWRCLVVSSAFSGKRLLQRHRLVYGALGTAMSEFVHAFSPRTLTPEEFEAAGGRVEHETPDCMGGGKAS
jgi:BolA protein